LWSLSAVLYFLLFQSLLIFQSPFFHRFDDTGEVYACRRVAESKVGNVSQDRLADVWVCQMESFREYEKFSKCSKCELKAWCRGCPAVAKGTNGDFYAADPQCWKTKNDITGKVLAC